MNCRFTDLRCKEVINICDGCRLGYVGDVECQLPEGQMTALIVPGPFRFFGLFGRGEDAIHAETVLVYGPGVTVPQFAVDRRGVDADFLGYEGHRGPVIVEPLNSRPIFRPEVSEFLTHFSGLLSCKIKK